MTLETARRTAGLVGALALSLLAGCAGFHTLPPPELAVARGTALEADITAGYATYGATLAQWGRWTADPLYSVRWCPSGVDPAAFVPYRGEGHWAPATREQAFESRGAPGEPFWASDNAEPWGEVTMHHGWWVHLDQGSPAGSWCWIPGAQPSLARVVWRVADGYVAWAPEPPSAGDGDESDGDDLAWNYSYVGTLFADLVDTLTEDAAAVADAATRGFGHDPSAPGRLRRVGPPAGQVIAARNALSQYTAAHPTVGTPTKVAEPQSTPSSSSSSPSSEPSGAVAKSSSRSTTPSVTIGTGSATVEVLPSAMVLYEQMARDPMIESAGPAGSPWLPMPPGLVYRAAASKLGVVSPSTSAAASAYQAATPSSSHSKSSSHSGHSSSSSSSSGSSHHK